MAEELTGHEKLELIWGVRGIAALINQTERQTFYLLETGKLPAKKVGNKWVGERGQIIRFFMEPSA